MGDFLITGYCFPYCFLEILGDKALMEEDKVLMGDPPVPPPGKTLTGLSICPLPLKC